MSADRREIAWKHLIYLEDESDSTLIFPQWVAPLTDEELNFTSPRTTPCTVVNPFSNDTGLEVFYRLTDLFRYDLNLPASVSVKTVIGSRLSAAFNNILSAFLFCYLMS